MLPSPCAMSAGKYVGRMAVCQCLPAPAASAALPGTATDHTKKSHGPDPGLRAHLISSCAHYSRNSSSLESARKSSQTRSCSGFWTTWAPSARLLVEKSKCEPWRAVEFRMLFRTLQCNSETAWIETHFESWSVWGLCVRWKLALVSTNPDRVRRLYTFRRGPGLPSTDPPEKWSAFARF